MDSSQKHIENVLEVQNLSISFGTNHVLKNFTFSLHKGENLVILGKSGSGKSVLIKCIIGLLQADHGSIKIFGEELPTKHSELDKMRMKMGFLFQSNALYDSMTIRNNLEFPLRRHFNGHSKEEVDELVMEVLTNVGLPHTADMMPSELSGGMRKRIALARTLILKPEIILYDEPTTGLDPITSKEINALILDIRRKYNTSSILISHDMDCVKTTADRILMLIDGTCYAEGTYDELSSSSDEKIVSFFK